MGIKGRLTIMSFLQFFVWGTWLTSLGVYLGRVLQFEGGQIAGVFSTMGIAAILMPALLGIVADRWVNAEHVLAACHLVGGILLFALSQVYQYDYFYWLMLLYTMMYMPTLGLSNSIAYNSLSQSGLDVVRDFPPIRVWGTVGFIFAMWLIDLFQWTASVNQLYMASAFSIIYGLYALTLPPCKPNPGGNKQSLKSSLGLDALSLFKEKRMAVFFIFSMLLGAALQITNTFGQPFLSDFGNDPSYASSFAVQHPGILTSISQMSEALFILTIPFFLKRFGIKTVMAMSMGAWILRFGLFGIGNPGSGFVFLILSMIVYGMAFDFFNVSGSLFVEQATTSDIRSSAQGLFILMVNGIGTIIGTKGSGWVVDYFTDGSGLKDWPSIWFTFAAYALIIGVLFILFFRYKKTEFNKRNI